MNVRKVLHILIYLVCILAFMPTVSLANELFPYVIQRAENAYFIGNGNYFSVVTEDSLTYVRTNTSSNRHKLSFTYDISATREYEVWIRVKGSSSFTAQLRQSSKITMQNGVQGFGDNWSWIRLSDKVNLSPGRYYLELSDFTGRIGIEQAIIKTNKPGQISIMTDGVSEPAIPTESPWANQGLNPFTSVLSNSEEYVSTTSGVLNIIATDVSIPGRGGLDFVLRRYRNSQTSSLNQVNSFYLMEKWELALPKIADRKLYFPNSSVADLYVAQYEIIVDYDTNTRDIIYHNTVNQYFKLIQHEKKDTFLPDDWSIEFYEVYLADGTYWKLDSQGRILKIQGTNPQNYMSFTYTNYKLTSIRDSLGRIYSFRRTQEGDVSTITVVRNATLQDPVEEILVTYIFSPAGLTVKNALQQETSYINGNEGISEIIYPSGKVSNYEYGTFVSAGATYSLFWVEDQIVSKLDSLGNKVKVRKAHFTYDFKNIEEREINSIKVSNYGYDQYQNEVLYSSKLYYVNSFGMAVMIQTINEITQKVENTVYNFWDRCYRLYEVQDYYGEKETGEEPLKSERWIYDYYGNNLYYRDPLGYETRTAYVNATYDSFEGTQLGTYPFYDNSVLFNSNIHTLPAGKMQTREKTDDVNIAAAQIYYKYDSLGQLTETKQRVLDEETQAEKFIVNKYTSYDSWGNCLSVTYGANPINGETPITVSYEYSSTYKYAYLTAVKQSILTNLLDSDTSGTLVTTSYEYYSATGLQKKIIDDKGHSVSYEYDALGRPLKITYLDGEEELAYEEVIYDDAGKRVKVLDAKRDSLVVHHFNGLGLEIKSETFTDFDANLEGIGIPDVHQKEYNWQGAVSKEIDAQNRVIQYEYDIFGRQTRIVTEPGVALPEAVGGQLTTQGQTESIIVYDDLNKYVTVTSPDLNVKKTFYDAKGQKKVVQVINNGLILESEFRYDGLGNLIWMKDAEDKEMGYDYNDLSQLVSIRYPSADGMVYKPTEDRLTEKKYYDQYGNMRKTVDRNGQVVEYLYNEYNQLCKVSSNSTTTEDDINYYYNRLGQLVRIGIGTPNSERYIKDFQYDARSRLSSESTKLIPGQTAMKTYAVEYQHDSNGNLESLTYPNSSGTMIYNYDHLDRITGMIWGTTGILNSAVYLPSNLLSQITFGNNVVESMQYLYINGRYLPKNIAYSLNQDFLGVFDYDYDIVGNLTRMNNHQYEYDDLGQLVGWKYYQDNDQVLLGEELILNEDMLSAENLTLDSTVITSDGLELARSQYQGVAKTSEMLDLHDKYPASNLIPNPAFETTPVGTLGLPPGWFRNIYSMTAERLSRISIVPDYAGGTGRQAVMLDNRGAATVLSTNIESVVIPVVPGQTYRQSGWLKAIDGATLYMGRTYYDSTGQRITSYTYIAAAVSPATWTYYESTTTAPAGAATCRISCTNYNNNIGAGLFDNMSFTVDAGTSDLRAGSTNTYRSTSGYELVKQAFTHHEDFKSADRIEATTTAVVDQVAGTVTLPQNTQPLFNMGTVTNINLQLPQVVVNIPSTTGVFAPLPVVTFSGYDIEESEAYSPVNDFDAPWQSGAKIYVPRDQIQFIKDLQIDVSATLYNEWSVFGFYGNWDLWVMLKINNQPFAYYKFTVGTEDEETTERSYLYNIQDMLFTESSVPIEVCYLVNKWASGSVLGGSFNAKFIKLTEVGYQINPDGVAVSSPYKLDQQLEPLKSYYFTANVVTPVNTAVRYELRSATSRIKDLTPNSTFTVSTKQDYYICPYLITSYLGSTPTVLGFSVKEIPPYVAGAKVVLKTYQAEKAAKVFEIITNDSNGSYIDYELNNGTVAQPIRATGSNGKYQVTFTQPGDMITLQAYLRTNATQSLTPVINDVYIRAIDPQPYPLPGKVITQDITVTDPAERLLLEISDVHTELLSVALKVGNTTIPGVYKTVDQIIQDNEILGFDISTAFSYYQFDIPVSLQTDSFVGRLEFTLNPDSTKTITPILHSYTLFNYFDGYVYSGSFNVTTPATSYTFDKVKVNWTAGTPTGTSVSFVTGSPLATGIAQSVVKTLSQPVNQFQMTGRLATTNNLVSPAITNVKVTAVGETPLQNVLDSTADINDGTSEPPIDPGDPYPPIGVLSVLPVTLSADHIVGINSIKIDHRFADRTTWSYLINSTSSFNAQKLPVVQIWVKPLSETSSISFTVIDQQEGRTERIVCDSDADGDFEVTKDLVLNKWNLLLLDLSKTNYNGIAKYAGSFKVVLNNATTAILIDGLSSLPANEVRYYYDGVGNRLQYHENGNITSYYYAPGTNRLMGVSNPAKGETIDYNYDYNGNLTYKRTVTGETSEVYVYTYNAFNQMTEVRRNDVLIAKYEYDHLGLRYKKIDYLKNQTIVYIYGAGNQPLYEEVYNNGSYVTPLEKTSYFYMGTRRIAKSDSTGISYYYTDHLGSTRIVRDASGNCEYYDYTPFGADFGTSSDERYKFTGKEDDGATGLQYFNARYYDPEIGRFVSEDPIKDGINWYAYCQNSPLRFVDIDGLSTEEAELWNGTKIVATKTHYVCFGRTMVSQAAKKRWEYYVGQLYKVDYDAAVKASIARIVATNYLTKKLDNLISLVKTNPVLTGTVTAASVYLELEAAEQKKRLSNLNNIIEHIDEGFTLTKEVYHVQLLDTDGSVIKEEIKVSYYVTISTPGGYQKLQVYEEDYNQLRSESNGRDEEILL